MSSSAWAAFDGWEHVMPAGREQEVSLGVSLWAEIILLPAFKITNESQPLIFFLFYFFFTLLPILKISGNLCNTEPTQTHTYPQTLSQWEVKTKKGWAMFKRYIDYIEEG